METIKTVGIKELKNNLSAYLKEVRLGVRVLVTDRDQVVAELREPLSSHPSSHDNPLYAQWIREGKVKPALVPNKGPYPRTGINLPPGTAQKLLDEDRNEERLEKILLLGEFSGSGVANGRKRAKKNSPKT